MKNLIIGIVVSTLSLTATQALADIKVTNECMKGLHVKVFPTPPERCGRELKPQTIENFGDSANFSTKMGCSYLVEGVGVGAKCPKLPPNAKVTFSKPLADTKNGDQSFTFCFCSSE